MRNLKSCIKLISFLVMNILLEIFELNTLYNKLIVNVLYILVYR